MAVEYADVVVVGGGPTGSSLAQRLIRSGHAVTLLEKAYLPRAKPCGESLSPGATPLLNELGVLDVLRAGPHGEKEGFTVFPYGAKPFTGTYANRGGGVPGRSTGLSIPRLHLDAALLDAARREGATVREGWGVREVSAWDGRGRTLQGVDARGRPFTVHTPLVIGADGVHSTVARRLGLSQPSRTLRQLAIVTHMRGVTDLGRYGEMHVSTLGYCGIAPLGGDMANVAIVLPAPAVSRGGTSPRTHEGGITGFFRAHLRHYPSLRERLQAAEVVGGPWTTGNLAGGVRARVGDGVMLVGDAGGYYDPFTGEGIFRGLRGAALAASTAASALDRRDTRAARLRPYAAAYMREFAPKRAVEVIVHQVITREPLFLHVASRLRRRPGLADALIGVTGDFLTPYEVLSPWYLAQLFA